MSGRFNYSSTTPRYTTKQPKKDEYKRTKIKSHAGGEISHRRHGFLGVFLKQKCKVIEQKSNQHDADGDNREEHSQQFWLDGFSQHNHRRQRKRSDCHHEGKDGSKTGALCKQAFRNRDGSEDVRIHRHTDQRCQWYRIPLVAAQYRFHEGLRDKVVDDSADTNTDKDVRSHLFDGGKHLILGIIQTVGDAQFKYGSFLNAVINFLIISFVVFLMVKAINTFRKKEDNKKDTPSEEVMYLKEITELFKKNKD